MSLENSFGNPADDAAGGAAEAKMPADETRRRGLAALSGFPFGVYTSESTRRRAGPLAEKCARAYSYLGELLGAAPEFALVVLDRSDWSERASDPFYGMPYYDAGNIFVAGEASDLSARLEEVASAAPASAAEILNEVYGTAADRLAPFAEMLVVHELAHAFHDSVPSGFPRAWLMELFADAALYAYVAFEEPDRLPLLETLVQVTLDYGLIKPVARESGLLREVVPASRAGVVCLVPVPFHDDGEGAPRPSRSGRLAASLGDVCPVRPAARGRARARDPPGRRPVAGVVEPDRGRGLIRSPTRGPWEAKEPTRQTTAVLTSSTFSTGACSGKWQAARWPVPKSRRGGSTSRRRSPARTGSGCGTGSPIGGCDRRRQLADDQLGTLGPRDARLGNRDRVDEALRVRVRGVLVDRLRRADSRRACRGTSRRSGRPGT